MSPIAVRQSIEALFQEAEAVVHDGTPMLAIIKSFPPAGDNPADQTDISLKFIPPAVKTLSAKEQNPSEQKAKIRRIEDLLNEAEQTDRADDTENGPAAETSQSAKLAVETPRKFGQMTETERALNENVTSDIVSLNNEAASDETAMPDEPPAPTAVDGADEVDSADLDQLVEEAKADLGAGIPEDISAVMADIAAAVGVEPPAEPEDEAPKDEVSEDEVVADEKNAPIVNKQLATFIGDTVRSVLNAELPSMVQTAVKDALDTMVVTKKITGGAKKKPGKTAGKAKAKSVPKS